MKSRALLAILCGLVPMLLLAAARYTVAKDRKNKRTGAVSLLE
jgi:hypothetical protein